MSSRRNAFEVNGFRETINLHRDEKKAIRFSHWDDEILKNPMEQLIEVAMKFLVFFGLLLSSLEKRLNFL